MGGPKKENAKSLYDGARFQCPGTTSFAKELTTAKTLGGMPTQVYVLSFTLIALTVFLNLPGWFYILQFFFWRLMYDAGIGYMLHTQSKDMAFSKWFREVRDKESWSWMFKKMEEGVMLLDNKGNAIDYKMSDYPAEFNAWMVFRFFVNIILAGDMVSHFVLIAVYFEIPETMDWLHIIFYVVGLVLVAFAAWSKADAHRVIGNFAWYWGDFFFLLDADLTFDGIFQMFPHPMYTVGYSFYYGLSLISQSYTVFYCSVIAHILQMVFLVLVENPHIEKIYGQMTEEKTVKEQLTSATAEFVAARKDMILIFNLSSFRASDVFTMLILLYSTVIAYIIPSWELHCAHFVAWRLFHTVGLGYILRRQSGDNFWVKAFPDAKRAFDSWKKIYNLSLTMNHYLFVVFAVHCFRFMPDNTHIMAGDYPFYCFKIVLGMLLIALNFYVSNACYDTLGDFGWFYGDFFIADAPKQLTYSGIYRYLNNPETSLAYCGYYGIALIASSYRVGVVAALAHASAVIFCKLVEEPFMNTVYTEVRPAGGLQTEVNKKLNNVKTKLENNLSGISPDKKSK